METTEFDAAMRRLKDATGFGPKRDLHVVIGILAMAHLQAGNPMDALRSTVTIAIDQHIERIERGEA